MTKLEAMADGIVGAVRELLLRSLLPLAERVRVLEQRQPEKGERGLDGVGIKGDKGDPGERGKDAEPVDYAKVSQVVREQAEALFAAIPVPKNGTDGQHGKDADPAEVARLVQAGIASALPDAVSKALETMLPSIVAKAADLVPAPRDGSNGKDGANGAAGKDAEPVDYARIFAEVREFLGAILTPKDGRDGRDAEVDEDAIVAKVVALLPLPRDGKDGRDADEDAIVARVLPLLPKPRDGTDGRDGKDADLAEVVAKVVPLIPAPKDGAPGAAGKDGADAVVDYDALVAKVLPRMPAPREPKDGRDGNDGKSITPEDVRPMMDAEFARWQLEFERRANDTLQRVVDMMPTPRDGVDGRDALTVDDFELAFDGRNLTVGLRAGERVISKTIKTHFPRYIGVHKRGMKAEAGDVTTFGGSLWLAKRDTTSSPPSDDWQLIVRRGTDGKDA